MQNTNGVGMFKNKDKVYPPRKRRAYICPRRYHAVPRILRLAVLVVLTFIALAGLVRGWHSHRDGELKVLPTDFAALARATDAVLWAPERPVRHSNATDIGDRYVYMRHLGEGKEGSATLYVDTTDGEVVVVKTFTGHLRNEIPAELAPHFPHFSHKWPAEIEASLLLAGGTAIGNRTTYVPVRDYFVLQPSDALDVHGRQQRWHWAMVTPFLANGTLVNLAEATRIHERTPQKLDKIFRPVFDALLEGLAPLHAAGYCHDDIKPNNVFVRHAKHWLLGDLGNVRHRARPWHTTARWRRENQWADCELNDVKRALKSYMAFLRAGCEDPAIFDRAFYAARQAWSQLYWDYVRRPVPVAATLRMSDRLDSGLEREWKVGETGAGADAVGACLQKAVDIELTSISVPLWSRIQTSLLRC